MEHEWKCRLTLLRTL